MITLSYDGMKKTYRDDAYGRDEMYEEIDRIITRGLPFSVTVKAV